MEKNVHWMLTVVKKVSLIEKDQLLPGKFNLIHQELCVLYWGCMAIWGRKTREREKWGFSRFWHSGPPSGRLNDGLLAQWYCVVVPWLV